MEPIYYPKGEVTVTFTDGTSKVIKKSGLSACTCHDNALEIVYKNGDICIFPLGVIKCIYKNNEAQECY